MAKWYRCDVCHHVYSCQPSIPNEMACPKCGISEKTATLIKQYRLTCLWHMTHVYNVENILQHGILNHYDAHKYKTDLVDISDPDAQKWRERCEPCYGRKVHDYAPLYITPRNPMLFVRREIQSSICLLEVSLSVLSGHEFLFTDGNAASRDTRFYNSLDLIGELPWDTLHAQYWSDQPDGKRKKCSEVLIYPKVEAEHISSMHCYSQDAVDFLSSFNMDARVSKNYFF